LEELLKFEVVDLPACEIPGKTRLMDNKKPISKYKREIVQNLTNPKNFFAKRTLASAGNLYSSIFFKFNRRLFLLNFFIKIYN
jgi:hypothetical protein